MNDLCTSLNLFFSSFLLNISFVTENGKMWARRLFCRCTHNVQPRDTTKINAKISDKNMKSAKILAKTMLFFFNFLASRKDCCFVWSAIFYSRLNVIESLLVLAVGTYNINAFFPRNCILFAELMDHFIFSSLKSFAIIDLIFLFTKCC